MRSLADRFLEKIEIDGAGCWLWAAAIDAHGYGRFFLGQRMQLAHRVAYEQIVGPIPDGLQLDHLCRNRACVNPAHLEPVTNAINAQRGDAGRHYADRSQCPQGHPYDEANTRLYQGRRYCRECHRIESRERQRAKRKGAAAA